MSKWVKLTKDSKIHSSMFWSAIAPGFFTSGMFYTVRSDVSLDCVSCIITQHMPGLTPGSTIIFAQIHSTQIHSIDWLIMVSTINILFWGAICSKIPTIVITNRSHAARMICQSITFPQALWKPQFPQSLWEWWCYQPFVQRLWECRLFIRAAKYNN